jgi:tetratricopeptide (TPR) repeat protein
VIKPRRASRAELPPAPLEFAYPLGVPGGEAQGQVIVMELPPEHSLLVLRALRLVLAWSVDSSLPAGTAAALDAWAEEVAAAGLADELTSPLLVLSGALKEGADAETIAHCCMLVAEWALAAGAEGTALLFAEAAALAWPTSARHAWIAGRMYRGRARHREAEAWLRRSARVAVWSNDHEAQNVALNSLGNLYAQQGSFPLAIRHLKQAQTLARRHRLREREAAVSHDLLAVSIWTGNHAQAEGYAARAFQLYGPRHPSLPRLAHDVAHLWNSQGRFALALPVLKALLAHFHAPGDRLRVLASTARAAGAQHEREVFEQAWAQAWTIVQRHGQEVAPLFPATLADLGCGAASAETWDRARHAFTRALHAARERGEHDVEMQAESALEMIERHQRVELPQRGQSGPAAQLARSFAASLAGQRGDGARAPE